MAAATRRSRRASTTAAASAILEYFVTARGNWNALGLENPTSSPDAFHDHTEQGKFFGYVSTLLDESTRLSVISAASYSAFQIPNNPNQMPLGDFGPANYSSLSLNENEYDTYVVNIAALQKKGTDGDAQWAVFSRYAKVNFVPDIFGDLVFNDVASNVTRESLLNGTQFDTSYIVNDRHTLRAGFAVSEEHTNVSNVSTVLPVDPVTGAIPPTPFTVTDNNSLLGWNIGTYVQDEWKLTNQLTLNTGLRFDQLYQYVDANQLSPRVALVYKPFDGTTVHAGYARYFTPPYQAQADPSQPRAVHQHHQSAGGPVGRSGEARALELLRRRRRPDACFRASMSGSTPITRTRGTCSTTASSARPWC